MSSELIPLSGDDAFTSTYFFPFFFLLSVTVIYAPNPVSILVGLDLRIVFADGLI